MSEYRDRTRRLRRCLVDEQDHLYIVHTPQGAINVEKWSYLVPGCVVVFGEDEDGRYRVLSFSEEAIASYPLKIRHKTRHKGRKTVGFKQMNGVAGEEDRVLAYVSDDTSR
jgi:hypothetical protein